MYQLDSEPGLAAYQVGDVLPHHDVKRCHDEDREQPEVPCDEEATELAERRFRPLIQPALERHAAVERDDDRGLREIVGENRQQPEHELRWPELRRGSDPAGADDEHDLHQHQIREPELAAKLSRVVHRPRTYGVATGTGNWEPGTEAPWSLGSRFPVPRSLCRYSEASFR